MKRLAKQTLGVLILLAIAVKIVAGGLGPLETLILILIFITVLTLFKNS